MQQSHGASMLIGFNGSPEQSAYNILIEAKDNRHQASPLVMNPVTGAETFLPMTWSQGNPVHVIKTRLEFLNGFSTPETKWSNRSVHSTDRYPFQASILSKPFYFLDDAIANSGSLSASGKLIISAEKEKTLKLQGNMEQPNPQLKTKEKSAFIKNGKVDIDLILLISASVSGLVLILIPERKKKRDLIKETNLALLRRPRD